MNYSEAKEMTLANVGAALAKEGIGVAGGFIGAGFLGRQVQKFVKPDEEVVSFTDGLMAWGGNNVPKLAIWYLLRNYIGEVNTSTEEVLDDTRKAMAGSVFFDTIMRLLNSGKNPATAMVMDWQVLGGNGKGTIQSAPANKQVAADLQRLVQENSALRGELNKALQRLASQPVVVQQPVVRQVANQQTQVAPPVVRQSAQPQQVIAAQPSEEAYQRQRQYGFMQRETTPPDVKERQRNYGFMQDQNQSAQSAQSAQPAQSAQSAQPVQPEYMQPVIEEREREFGFMDGSDVAAEFGML